MATEIDHYPYTSRDLLVGDPEHYMYAPFGDRAFLAAYADDRRAHVRSFRDGGGHEPAAVPDDAEPADRVGEVAGSGPVETLPVLWRLAGDVLAGAGSQAVHHAWADELARKFDIAKRFRSRYGDGLSTVVHDSVAPDGYPLAAFIVARAVGDGPNLRRLNALLKINDLVCSAGRDAFGPPVWPFAAEALSEELRRVRRLADRLHVDVPADAVEAEGDDAG